MKSKYALVNPEGDILSFDDDVPIRKPYIWISEHPTKDGRPKWATGVFRRLISVETPTLLVVGRKIHLRDVWGKRYC